MEDLHDVGSIFILLEKTFFHRGSAYSLYGVHLCCRNCNHIFLCLTSSHAAGGEDLGSSKHECHSTVEEAPPVGVKHTRSPPPGWSLIEPNVSRLMQLSNNCSILVHSEVDRHLYIFLTVLYIQALEARIIPLLHHLSIFSCLSRSLSCRREVRYRTSCNPRRSAVLQLFLS